MPDNVYVGGLPPTPVGMTARQIAILRSDLPEDVIQILVNYVQQQAQSGTYSSPFVDVKDPAFGAVGDGVTDDTAAIQAAIDYALANGMKTYLSPGQYRITDTIHMNYGRSFAGCVLEGDNYAFRGEFGFAGASIYADFSDRPAVNIQGSRGSVIRGIGFRGLLRPWIEDQGMGGADTELDDTDPDNWDDPSLSATADGRYCPYAAITVDAFSGVRPGESYPDMDYSGDPLIGGVQYGKAYSSDVLIENISISGFTVGIANQPADADGNADFTCIRRVNIDCVKWGISICNTQSRSVHIEDVKMGAFYCALTNNRHGRRSGKLNGTIDNLSIGSGIQAIDFNSTAYAGPLTFLHLYSEALWRIGDIMSQTANETGIVFQSCLFGFESQTETRGVPSTVLGQGQQGVNIHFVDSVFVNYPSVYVLFQADGVKLDGCLNAPAERQGGTIADEYVRLAHNALCGGTVIPYLTSNQEHRIKFTSHDLDVPAVGHNVITGRGFKWSYRNKCIPLWVRSVCPANAMRAEELIVPHYQGVMNKNSELTDVSLVDKTLTFTWAPLADWRAEHYGPDVGDVLYDDDSMSVFFVSNRVGTTITAILQNNYKSDGLGGFTTCDAEWSNTDGNIYVGCSRLYTPNYPTIVTQTASSAVLTDVGRDDEYAAYLDTGILAGDRVAINEYVDFYINPQNSAVTNVDSTARTITISGAADRTVSRKRLDFLVRVS